ncbi:hypothetical protein EV175_005573, partial [Coemansia sp. RSA 1933]
MGVYSKAFLIMIGGLLGGSAGFYYQAKEDQRLTDMRKLRLAEMERLQRLDSNDTDNS